MSGSPVIFDLRGKRVFVTGHAGMVGSAIVRRLERENCDIVFATRRDLDLRRSDEVERFMAQAQPDAVFVAAGKVGGINANSKAPADFIGDNEKPLRQKLYIVIAPDFTLEADDGGEFFQLIELANF